MALLFLLFYKKSGVALMPQAGVAIGLVLTVTEAYWTWGQ